MRGCESVRSERVAIRWKGGRTICGCGLGLVCLGECAGFVVWGVEGVRTALHLSQGRATRGVGRERALCENDLRQIKIFIKIKLSGSDSAPIILSFYLNIVAFKGWLWWM